MEKMQLKKTDEGEVVQVVTTVSTQEVPLSLEELDRQIEQHESILDGLRRKRDVVNSFVESDNKEETVKIN